MEDEDCAYFEELSAPAYFEELEGDNGDFDDFTYHEELSAEADYVEELSISDGELNKNTKPKAEVDAQNLKDLEKNLEKLLDDIEKGVPPAEEDRNLNLDNLSEEVIFFTAEELLEELENLKKIYQKGYIHEMEFLEREKDLNRSLELAKNKRVIPHKDYSNWKSVEKKNLSLKPKDRNIRIFISSTFKDMGSEREIILKETIPKLHQLFSKRGIYISQVDLRWGITSEQSTKGDTIDICLNEVDKCRPYFVCMLGNRYGWAQPANNSDSLLEKTFQKGSIHFPWIRKFSDRSITELEVRHAVLNQPTVETSAKALFFYRENKQDTTTENPLHSEKLSELKREIVERGFNVNNYKTPNDLNHLFYFQMKGIIENDFPEEKIPNQFDLERFSHLAFQESRSRVYVPPTQLFEKIDSTLSSGFPVVVDGVSGSGKSSLLANWAKHFSQHYPEKLIIVHYIGSTASSAELGNLLSRILYEIDSFFGLNKTVPTDPKEMEIMFPEFLVEASHLGGLILLLDALDQLSDKTLQELRWLPTQLPPNVNIITSTGTNSRALEVLLSHNYSRISLPALNPDQIKDITHTYLTSFGKSLSHSQLEAIIQAPQCNNVLFLRTLLEELRLFGIFEELDSKIKYYLSAKNIQELFACVVKRWQDYFYLEYPQLIEEILSFLYASRKGLTEDEILNMTGITQTVWSTVYLAFGETIVNQNGFLTFFHDALRLAVEEICTKKCEEIRMKIVRYWMPQTNSLRRVDEIAYQLKQCSRLQELADFISNVDNFHLLQSINYGVDLFIYWKLISQINNFEQRLIKSTEAKSLKDKENIMIISEVATFLVEVASYKSAKTIFLKILSDFMNRLNSDSSASGDVLTFEEEIDICTRLVMLYEKTAEYSAAEVLLEKIYRKIQNSHKNISQDKLAGVLRDLSVIYRRQGKYNQSEPLIEKALSIYIKFFGELHITVARTKNEIGRLKQDMGQYREAEHFFNTAKMDIISLVGQNHPKAIVYQKDSADLLILSSRYEEGLQQIFKVCKLYEETLGTNHPLYAEALQSIAGALQYQGKWEESAEYYDKAVAIQERIFGRQHPDLARTISEYSQLRLRERNFPACEALLLECLEIRKKVLGVEHSDYALTLGTLGSFYQKKEQYDKSISYFKEANAIQKKVFGNDNIEYAGSLLNMAGVYQLQRNFKECPPLYSEALRVLVKRLGLEHISVAVTINDLGLYFFQMGNWILTEKLFELALVLYNKVFGLNHQSTAQVMYNFAKCYKAKNEKPEKAESLARSALSIFSVKLGDTHEKTIQLKNWISEKIDLNNNNPSQIVINKSPKENPPENKDQDLDLFLDEFNQEEEEAIILNQEEEDAEFEIIPPSEKIREIVEKEEEDCYYEELNFFD